MSETPERDARPKFALKVILRNTSREIVEYSLSWGDFRSTGYIPAGVTTTLHGDDAPVLPWRSVGIMGTHVAGVPHFLIETSAPLLVHAEYGGLPIFTITTQRAEPL